MNTADTSKFTKGIKTDLMLRNGCLVYSPDDNSKASRAKDSSLHDPQ